MGLAKKISVSVLIIWLSALFILMVVEFRDWKTEALFPSSAGSTAFYSDDLWYKRSLVVKLSSLDKGYAQGVANLLINTNEYPIDIGKTTTVYLDVKPITPFGGFSTMVEMTFNEEKYKNSKHLMYWESSKVEMRLFGDLDVSPFDDYLIGVRVTPSYIDPETSEHKELLGIPQYIYANLPKNYLVEGVTDAEVIEEHFNNQLYRATPNEEDQHWFQITRTSWHQYFVCFVLSFLLVPIYLLAVSKSNTPSLEVISAMLALIAVRSLLIGDVENFEIYTVDLIFLSILLLIAIIPLVKILIRKN